MSYPHKLPELPYGTDELEPYIDKETMEIHHGKHHAGYVKKLNNAIEEYKDLHDKSVEELLKNLNDIPEEIRERVKNVGGGHYNHSLFWPILKNNEGKEPEGEVREEIEKNLGGYEKFKEDFANAATGVFGSGWAWLVFDEDKLKIDSTHNQDSPISEGKIPILGIDVWEHAYYLKYQNKRGEYVDNFFNVINWDKVNENLEKAKNA